MPGVSLQVPQFTELHGMKGCLVAPTKIIAGGYQHGHHGCDSWQQPSQVSVLYSLGCLSVHHFDHVRFMPTWCCALGFRPLREQLDAVLCACLWSAVVLLAMASPVPVSSLCVCMLMHVLCAVCHAVPMLLLLCPFCAHADPMLCYAMLCCCCCPHRSGSVPRLR
jgi:hypothetical protein